MLNYEGGAHVFSDGSDVFHSDFMSGWRRQDLQRVLDECDNDSEAAVSSSGPARATPEGPTDAAAAAAQMPDAFCPEWLTFRGTPKVEGVAAEEDFDIVDDLGAWVQVPVPVVPRLTRRPPLQRTTLRRTGGWTWPSSMRASAASRRSSQRRGRRSGGRSSASTWRRSSRGSGKRTGTWRPAAAAGPSSWSPVRAASSRWTSRPRTPPPRPASCNSCVRSRGPTGWGAGSPRSR